MTALFRSSAFMAGFVAVSIVLLWAAVTSTFGPWVAVAVIALSLGMAAATLPIVLGRHPAGIEVYRRDHDDDVERYLAVTPAGDARITRVLDDRGEAFMIEAEFRGQEYQRYYVPPSLTIAKARVVELVEEWQQERQARR